MEHQSEFEGLVPAWDKGGKADSVRVSAAELDDTFKPKKPKIELKRWIPDSEPVAKSSSGNKSEPSQSVEVTGDPPVALNSTGRGPVSDSPKRPICEKKAYADNLNNLTVMFNVLDKVFQKNPEFKDIDLLFSFKGWMNLHAFDPSHSKNKAGDTKRSMRFTRSMTKAGTYENVVKYFAYHNVLDQGVIISFWMECIRRARILKIKIKEDGTEVKWSRHHNLARPTEDRELTILLERTFHDLLVPSRIELDMAKTLLLNLNGGLTCQAFNAFMRFLNKESVKCAAFTADAFQLGTEGHSKLCFLSKIHVDKMDRSKVKLVIPAVTLNGSDQPGVHCVLYVADRVEKRIVSYDPNNYCHLENGRVLANTLNALDPHGFLNGKLPNRKAEKRRRCDFWKYSTSSGIHINTNRIKQQYFGVLVMYLADCISRDLPYVSNPDDQFLRNFIDYAFNILKQNAVN